MKELKIKAPNTILHDKQLKLYDFIEDFVEIESKTFLKIDKAKCKSKSVTRLSKNGKIIFKEHYKHCPECSSKKIVKNGYNTRKLHILNEGYVTTYIERYICKNCGKNYQVDMSDVVVENNNITNEIKDIIWKYYAISKISLRKTRLILKSIHNINISYQSIEDIILSFKYSNKNKIEQYSGYYLFDSLWIKINGEWNYLYALMDSKYNTIINLKMASSEKEKEIYTFLRESTRNQSRKSVTTDLKEEYRKPIDKLMMEHQFCQFHLQQKINRDLKTFIKENNLNENEINKLYQQKKRINSIIYAQTIKNARKILEDILNNKKNYYKPIIEICEKTIQPYLKNIKKNCEDSKIERTSSRLENMFLKIMPKHIKRKMKTFKGAETRAKLTLAFWDLKNMKSYIH